MIIKKTNRFVEFFKKFGLFVAVAVIVLGITLAFIITAVVNSNKTIPTNAPSLQFVLPMNSPIVLKDYSDTKLQKNETLRQWEAHLAVDLKSDDGLVYSVLDGEVTNIIDECLEGKTIEITHANGFVSYYGSLDEQLNVTIGDKVKAGTELGSASKSASGEMSMDPHLHFYLLLNNEEVDPNNYLDLQLK